MQEKKQKLVKGEAYVINVDNSEFIGYFQRYCGNGSLAEFDCGSKTILLSSSEVKECVYGCREC